MSGIYKLKKAWRYLKHFGWKEFWIHVRDRLEPEEIPYDPWFRSHCPDEHELERQRQTQIPGEPLISVVVPVYRTPEKFLRELIDSLQVQTYRKWELCLADASGDDDSVERVLQTLPSDSRIIYKRLENNAGISENTNAAVAMATGDYIGFMDHDDLLAPQALFRVAEAIGKKGADLVYTDEDKVTADLKKHLQPHFKPDFNPDLLRSNNYITHFLVVKRTLIGDEPPLNPAFDGAQDYDFILRMTEKAANIVHVPEIVYHWRTHEASTADNPMSKLYAYEAGKRAIEAQLKRRGLEGEVTLLPDYGFYRVRYAVPDRPLISVIIPNKDHAAALKACVSSLQKADYDELEIIIVENNSTEAETFALYEDLKADPRVRIVTYEGGFNYSAINNLGVSQARGEYLLFLNNDVRGDIGTDWITEMLGMCRRPDTGAVGAKLYYPNDTIQHAGCVIGIGGVAGAMFVGLARSRSGYMHKASIIQNLSAVTAACMMVKTAVFREVGGFEEKLAVAFNDMDLCLKIGRAGYRIVYDPYAELYHDESLSRGPEDSEEKVRRFQEEIEYMRTEWIDILKNGDPNYNKNLSLKKWNYSLRP
ncbi:MAG: glycosyltransferase [Lachnospiraceae bacterium]|nr:glycosyltransferase [Lachnospiraceae bacterium]